MLEKVRYGSLSCVGQEYLLLKRFHVLCEMFYAFARRTKDDKDRHDSVRDDLSPEHDSYYYYHNQNDEADDTNKLLAHESDQARYFNLEKHGG